MEPMKLPLRHAAALLVVLSAACSSGDPSAAELAGDDTDGDGVRDDVAAHIETYDPAMQAYLSAVAANEQRVVTFTDGDDAYSIAAEANRLVTCIPEGLDRDAARDAAAEVREKVADTDARRDNQAKFSAAISGESFPEPDCDTGASPGAGTATPDR